MHLVAIMEAVSDDSMLRKTSLLPKVSVDGCPEQVQISFGFAHNRSRITCTLLVFGVAQLVFQRKYCSQGWCEVLVQRICPFIEINSIAILYNKIAPAGVNLARLNVA